MPLLSQQQCQCLGRAILFLSADSASTSSRAYKPSERLLLSVACGRPIDRLSFLPADPTPALESSVLDAEAVQHKTRLPVASVRLDRQENYLNHCLLIQELSGINRYGERSHRLNASYGYDPSGLLTGLPGSTVVLCWSMAHGQCQAVRKYAASRAQPALWYWNINKETRSV